MVIFYSSRISRTFPIVVEGMKNGRDIHNSVFGCFFGGIYSWVRVVKDTSPTYGLHGFKSCWGPWWPWRRAPELRVGQCARGDWWGWWRTPGRSPSKIGWRHIAAAMQHCVLFDDLWDGGLFCGTLQETLLKKNWSLSPVGDFSPFPRILWLLCSTDPIPKLLVHIHYIPRDSTIISSLFPHCVTNNILPFYSPMIYFGNHIFSIYYTAILIL